MKPFSTIIIYIILFVLGLLPLGVKAATESEVVVGKITDSYDVTPVGQFAYSMPLAVASGTGGMAPKLSIAYSSSNGTGLLGHGFDLQGLSIISRAPQNLFNDGKADIIRFTATDRFTLDGSRLQRIKAEGNVVEYRTERDGYARILAYGSQANPDSFVVYGKEGIKYKYISYIKGNSLYWNLVKAIDTKGNYFTITYSGGQNQEVVPTRIDYTGNDGAGLRPYASVSFGYTSQSCTPAYISGIPVARTKFISSISVVCDGACIRKYSMEYTRKKNKLFLSSITESTTTQQKRPTRFSWDNSEQYSISNREFTNAEFKNKRIATGDFNGDGKADFIAYSNSNSKDYNFLIYLSQGDSFASPIPFTYSIPSTGSRAVRIEEICVGDFNGDGHDDIVVERSNSPFYYLDYWECNVSDNGQRIGFVYQKTIAAPYQLAHTMRVMDANCDGAADLFAYNKNYYSTSYYTLLSASSSNKVTPLNMGHYAELANDCWDNAGCVCLIDLDGDGTNEILNIKEQKSANGCGSVLYTISPTTGELKEITTKYSYNGLKTTITNANGYSSSKIVDRHGRLAKSIDEAGNSINYTYDINDNCICVAGPTTTIRTEFDQYGHRTKLIDPDLGEISYTYNGYGELVSQTDSHGTTTFEYDALGRLTKETRPDFTYTYAYDGQLKGLLDSKSCSNNTSIAYQYDKYGRTIAETHKMGNRTFTTRTSYNGINKPDTISYPSGLKIKLNYYSTGFQQSIHNAKNGLLIWEVDGYDEFGNVAVAHIGNDRHMGRIYSPVGTITEAGTDNILYCEYGYDECNNLTIKIDKIRGNEEYYDYDALSRLVDVDTEANGKSARHIHVDYDDGGNIVSKSTVGNIEYEDGTNRLTMVDGYKIPEWESIKYTSFNKITEVIATRNDGISDMRYFYTLTYGPDKTRCMQGLYPPGRPSTKYDSKYYVGNIYDEANNNGKVLKQDYIYADGNLVAIHQTNQGVEKMLYVHLDNIGSVWAYTDESGDIVEELNYDPWGDESATLRRGITTQDMSI